MEGVGLSLRRPQFVAVVLALSVLLALPGAPPATAEPGRSVIVQAHDPAAAAAAVRAAGGTIGILLPIVDGFSATVPGSRVAALQRHPAVRAVTSNAPVTVAHGDDDGGGGPRSVFAKEVGADKMWAEGIDGRGVRVALIDTGVAPVADLAGRVVPVPHQAEAGKLAACVDFSGEGHCGDSYGHGTFVAGLIAGDGSASGGTYKGIAPGADVVSIKIAGRDGSADVTKVLAAIQWVVSFSEELNIRVLNLSLGTNSRAPWRLDPLNYAVQRAWGAGIVVVVSASNRGPGPGTISKPADDPLVVSVGAVDDRQTWWIWDDRIPDFSARGPTATDLLPKPDLVAPGGRVVSLRSPGSYIEQHAPGGVDEHYRRGSGTSMSAAIVSGAAALLIQANPSWTQAQPERWLPDRVKYALMATARKVASTDPMAVGAGLINVNAARSAPDGLANQNVTVIPLGTGSLDDSRGDVLVSRECSDLEILLGDEDCDHLSGNETGQGRDWDAQQYTSSEWTPQSWYESQWVNVLGSSWFGSSWFGSSWFGSSWFGSSWYGYGDQTPYGASVAGSSWYGAWS